MSRRSAFEFPSAAVQPAKGASLGRTPCARCRGKWTQSDESLLELALGDTKLALLLKL